MSPIALGCEPLGGWDWGHVDLELCRRAVRRALEMGIDVFDTADVYGLGRGEEELSRALGDDRHRATIVTKGGVRWTQDAGAARATTRRDSSPAYLTSAIEASLTRLRIDAIPLYLVHSPDPRTVIDETLECLENARRAGKIVHYGLSNFDVDVVRRTARSFPISAIEGPCSLLGETSQRDQYKEARNDGLLTLTYGPLAQGLLSGKYSPSSVFDTTDRRHRLSHFSPDSWARNGRILRTLSEVSKEVSRSPAQVAIRWVIDSGASSAVIVGGRSPAQVGENLGALGWSLSDEQFKRLAEAGRTSMPAGGQTAMVNDEQ